MKRLSEETSRRYKVRADFQNKGGQGWELSTGAGRTDSLGSGKSNFGEVRGKEEWQTLKAVWQEEYTGWT